MKETLFDNGMNQDGFEAMMQKLVSEMCKRLARQREQEMMEMLHQLMELSRTELPVDPMEQLTRAVSKGSGLFWAKAAWTVVYCVARDRCGYNGSVKDFERWAAEMEMPKTFGFACTPGRIQATLDTHPYMREHVEEWASQGAKRRELVLLEFLLKTGEL